MPYDPRMMAQIGQMGVGMMGPQQGSPFDRANQPRPWWEQATSGRSPQQGYRQGYPQDDPSNPDAKQPPSLYDMMLSLGRMTRPEYDKAIRGPGPYGIAPKDAARVGPMGFLASLGGWGSGGGGAR